MNFESSRIGIADSEFWWRENMIRIGDLRLANVPDVGTSIFSTSTKTIVKKFWYFIGTTSYVALFFSDGTASQVRYPDGLTTPITTAANTFITPDGNIPSCVQWGTQYLLISNNNTKNDYWIWDGALLYGSGTISPVVTILFNGRNYSSAPTITPYGGSGSGIVLTSTVNGGGVIEIAVDNPGKNYNLGDQIQLQFSDGGSDRTAVLQAVLSKGAVTAVNLISGGSNYSNSPTAAITGGGGTGAAVSLTVGTGGVTSVAINSQGTNYSTASVSFSGGGGSGATATATISGIVSSTTQVSAGSGYTTAPTVTFVGGGATTPAQATANITSNTVSSLTITNPGEGYTSAPTIMFTGGGGSGANYTAVITGGVVSITVTNPGTGYSSAPSVVITGDGIGASATATAAGQGVIAAINLTAGGSGYTEPPTITITDSTGSGAQAVAFISSGSIQSVNVIDGGSDYITAPQLSVVGGNGEGAILLAQLQGTSVAYINVTNGGQGIYNGINVIIQANNIGSNVVPPGGGSGATATAIVEGGILVAVKVTNGGSGYNTAPTIQFELNSKDTENQQGYPVTVPAATAILTPSVVASVIVQAPGQGFTQEPGILVEPGANNAAAATVDLMPFGTSGASIASFDSRVWLAHPFQNLPALPTNGTLLLGAPGSLTDFATSDGGLIFPASSPFLGSGFTGLSVVGDYLYAISNSSTDVISNVQTSSNPSTTTFNYDNTDPQTGTEWVNTIQNFSRTALITNRLGVFGIYGGAVTKLSKKLDRLFQNAVFPPTAGALVPSAAIGTIRGQRVYAVLLTINDTVWGGTRNVLATWDEQDWFITTQSPPGLNLLSTQTINSTPQAWGTDGKSVWPLFQNFTGLNPVRLATKLFGADTFPVVKSSYGAFLAATDYSNPAQGVTFSTFNFDSENGSYPSSYMPVEFEGRPIVSFGSGTDAIPGCFLGASMISSSLNFELQHMVLGYVNIFGGVGTPPSDTEGG
jgi:hypothetical protein